ncbi:hypothetical protein D5W64_12770 [Salmonella enterica subsp. enterica serovar Saintpaul]|nr:hypothetical protein [Salmonella enterica subsp. enterica serovar Saintpaul]
MARNADIRLYLVKRFPRMSISSLLHVTKSILRDVKKINAVHDVTLPRGFVVTAPYSHLNDKHDASFVLRTPTKITSEIGDEEFTIASVEAFRDELMAMCIDNTAGINTFENMLLGEDSNFKLVTEFPIDVIAEINVKLYSCLVRRHQNRGRRGCDNDYFFDVENPFSNQITNFTVSNITFIDTEVHFKLISDNDKVNTVLKSDYHLTVPILSDADPKVDSKTYYMLFRNEMEQIDLDWCRPGRNRFVNALDRAISTVFTAVASGVQEEAVICRFGSYSLIMYFKRKGSETTASLLLEGFGETIKSIEFIDFNGLMTGGVLFGNKDTIEVTDGIMDFLHNDYINNELSIPMYNWIRDINFDKLFVPTLKTFEIGGLKETVAVTPKPGGYDIVVSNKNGIVISNTLFKAPEPLPVTTEDGKVPPKVISFWKRLIDKFY